MNCLTFSGPVHADSYMYSRTRAVGKSLATPSLSLAQLKPVLTDFQLSSGCAPRPGTKTMLHLGQCLVERLPTRLFHSLHIRCSCGVDSWVQFLNTLLNGFIALLGPGRPSAAGDASRACSAERHDSHLEIRRYLERPSRRMSVLAGAATMGCQWGALSIPFQ